MTNRPFVSVVVCSYNGQAYLDGTLAALMAQTYPNYEVIVVDDGSTDATAAIARGFGVRVISHATNLGLGTARNTGLKAARGGIIAYTDDDCVPDAGWVEQLVAAFDRQSVMAVGGRTVAVSRRLATERYMDEAGYGNPAPQLTETGAGIWARLSNYIREMVAPRHNQLAEGDHLHAIYTLNAAYRTAKLRSIGGFDATLRAAEDTDVSVRLRSQFPEFQIVFASTALVGHRHRRHFWPWFRQTYQRSQDSYRQFRSAGSYPPIYPFPVAYVLMSVILLIVAPWVGLGFIVIGPVLVYWWWQLRIQRAPQVDKIFFPYMQFLIEGAALAGYLKAAVQRS